MEKPSKLERFSQYVLAGEVTIPNANESRQKSLNAKKSNEEREVSAFLVRCAQAISKASDAGQTYCYLVLPNEKVNILMVKDILVAKGYSVGNSNNGLTISWS